MPRGIYRANDTATITTSCTLLYITAPSNKIVKVLSAYVTNNSNETNEQLDVYWQLVGTLGTPTATTLTPTKTEQGDQAAGSTVKSFVTASEPTLTANTKYHRLGVPSIGGWRYEPIEGKELVIAGAATWVLFLGAAPSSLVLAVECEFQEVG